jgi:5-methylcytosine-specific restriction endonuclease McrA
MIDWELLIKLVEEADAIGSDPPVPRKVRQEVLQRDGRCMICGRTTSLHIHHINPGKPSTADNLITLCRACHQAVHCLLYVAGKHRFVNVIGGFRK